MLRFSKNTQFLFLCVLAIFCFYQITAAQSGRRTKNDAPAEQKAPVESKSTETIKEIKTEKPAVRISSLLVVGEVQHNFQYYKSNQIDGAIKECVRSLKSTTRTVTKGSGKTSYEDAKKLAEKETETYILWLGFLSTVDDYGNEYIESLQYAVLTPKTAKVLTRGEIVPGENKVVAPGGVLQNRGRLSATVQMLLGVRQVAEILLRGWLD